jgi:hypothetical protein
LPSNVFDGGGINTEVEVGDFGNNLEAGIDKNDQDQATALKNF